MATAPKRRCIRPGCAQYAPCSIHAAENDRQRGSASSRGYDRAWWRVRLAFLAEHPLCADCIPTLTPAIEVHHVRKVADYPDRRLDWDNLRALCKACHSARTARGE